MSSTSSMNRTASPSTASSITAEEAAALNGAMDMLVLAAICTGILIPISIALFFSFSRIWRTPVFILNVFALALGFAYGGMTINYLKGAFAGNIPSSRFTLAFSAMAFCIPVCVQSILVIRVVAVYPPRTLTWMRNMLIYGIFAALFIARLVNMCIYLTDVSRRISETGADSITIAVYEMNLPNGKLEWFLQSANDLYASTLFLLRLNKARAFRSKDGALGSVFTNGGRSSYSARLKALFWIAVFNFVFPVIINVVIVIMSFREPNVLRTSDFIELNNYIEIICVLLATIWCTGTYWDNSPAPSMASNQPLAFGGGETTESLTSAKFTTRSLAESPFAPPDVEMVRIPK